MDNLWDLVKILSAFFIIAVASSSLSVCFQKIKLPKITGLLLIGIICGPFILQLVQPGTIGHLNFLNDISLAFIAFAAGSELYLKELRSQYKSITWVTISLIIVTMIFGVVIIFLISPHIAFMKQMSSEAKIAVSLLISTIFLARSPASAIAIINELRAKGALTQLSLSVTVIKDVLVIVLFTICFGLANSLIGGEKFEFLLIFILIFEIIVSIGIGYLLSKLLEFILSSGISNVTRTILIIASGWGVYILSAFIRKITVGYFAHEIYLEPLLICITASFMLTNFSIYRTLFSKLMTQYGTYIYVIFFTLTGASISIDILIKTWEIALVFFFIRIITMIIGAWLGGTIAGDSLKQNMIGWMPYVTQAGVGLGLVMVVATKYTGWGNEFATILIAVIVLNQIVGPPLFKWALTYLGESHVKASGQEFDGVHDALIIGLENQSVALAKQLQTANWNVKIATRRKSIEEYKDSGFDIHQIKRIDLKALNDVDADKAEAIICMNTDEENYRVCEIAYEQFGTKDLVVRLNQRQNFEKFHKLGVLIVDPFTAIVSLLDHFVRSPHATSLLLGMEENNDTVEIEIRNSNMHGMALRNIRLPDDILILSVMRGGHFVLSHGYTRLRIGDWVTIVGKKSSIEKVQLMFE